MGKLTMFRMVTHDKLWHSIWAEDGEGQELPFCEIINTDQEDVQQIVDALNAKKGTP